MNMDIKINDGRVLTIKEIEPGQCFITLTAFRRQNGLRLAFRVRRRTDDPFKSETLFGTPVTTFPSEKVHPVDVY